MAHTFFTLADKAAEIAGKCVDPNVSLGIEATAQALRSFVLRYPVTLTDRGYVFREG